MYSVPSGENEIPNGSSRNACVAGAPSPLDPGTPHWPATSYAKRHCERDACE
jgi:hypothetical protein